METDEREDAWEWWNNLDSAFQEDHIVSAYRRMQENGADEEADEGFVCAICGEECVGYGNNPQPLYEGVCCDVCNAEKVIPSRLKQTKTVGKTTQLNEWIENNKEMVDLLLQDYQKFQRKLYGGTAKELKQKFTEVPQDDN